MFVRENQAEIYIGKKEKPIVVVGFKKTLPFERTLISSKKYSLSFFILFGCYLLVL